MSCTKWTKRSGRALALAALALVTLLLAACSAGGGSGVVTGSARATTAAPAPAAAAPPAARPALTASGPPSPPPALRPPPLHGDRERSWQRAGQRSAGRRAGREPGGHVRQPGGPDDLGRRLTRPVAPAGRDRRGAAGRAERERRRARPLQRPVLGPDRL